MNPRQQFKDLHARDSLFVMPNAWCEGSARLIQHLGYSSIGTTSAGIAYAQGFRDSSLQMDDESRFASIERIVRAVDIAVSADLENGLADSPKGVEHTFRRAVDIGCAGASIEDIANYEDASKPVFYDRDQACDRVQAACEAAHRLDRNFIVTARTDYLLGANDYSLSEVITRLRAFEQAGADCLFAPGLRSIEDVRAVQSMLTKPLNVLPVPGMSIEQLKAASVRRVSLGSALFRAAYAQISTVLQGLEQPDGLDFMQSTLSFEHLNDVMR